MTIIFVKPKQHGSSESSAQLNKYFSDGLVMIELQGLLRTSNKTKFNGFDLGGLTFRKVSHRALHEVNYLHTQSKSSCFVKINIFRTKYPNFCLQEDKVLFRIGAHLLEGKIEKLKKPLAALKKVEAIKSVSAPDHDESARENSGKAGSVFADVHYQTIAIIRNKIIFKTVPKPVGYRALDAATYA